jgi:hypothetical protein
MSTDLMVWGLVAHLIADWPLQNSWMAYNKVSLRHPAAWIHGAIHFAAMSFVFPVGVAALIAASHMIIDTRTPLEWWRRVFRFTNQEPMALHVNIWMDQVAHIIMVAIAAQLTPLLLPGAATWLQLLK